jgi:putative ABC transport system substrate-binding protein
VLLPAVEGDAEEQRRVAAFLQGLRAMGWTEGANVQIDFRWVSTDSARIRRGATELIDLKPDVILTESALTLAPLQQITKTIPIVFLQIGDPVGSGFVSSLAHPGGNITGFSPGEFSIYGKLLEILKEVAPQVRVVNVIYNPVQSPQIGNLHAIEAAAPALGVQVNAASVGNSDQLKQLVENFVQQSGVGVIVSPNPITTNNRGLIIELMAQYRIPAAYSYPFFVREGGLVSYGIDPTLQFNQAASYVDRILKGAKPSELPVQQPTKFYLTINLNTAKVLGLKISRDFLLLADEVIE